jgi:hypothetical protein
MVGRDGVVGIATRYVLDVPEIESRWDDIFCTCPDRPWGLPRLRSNVTASFPGVKRQGRGVYHPPHLSPRLKKVKGCTSTPSLDLRGLF